MSIGSSQRCLNAKDEPIHVEGLERLTERYTQLEEINLKNRQNPATI